MPARPRRRLPIALIATAAALASACVSIPAAHAEDVLETADGVEGCREFQAKNDRELKSWSKSQPSEPYQYPKEDTVLGAPWGKFLKGVGSTTELIFATIIPHVGAQLRGDLPAAVVSWPWQLPLGPAFSCSRKQGSFTVKNHLGHRAILEPGFTSGKTVGVFVRPAYRFIWHPSDWVVGVGGGLGSTIELYGKGLPVRPSISPEGVVHFGHCCDSSYFTFAARYDRFFNGVIEDVATASLGYTFF